MPKQARPCIDQVTIPSEESAVTSEVCSVKRLRRLGLQTPRNGIDFDMHFCFLLKELRSLYATHWVAPIVWPYKHDGFLRSCDFHSFSDVFPASPASEFFPYIMIVTVSGDPYSPDVTDVHLPKNFREFAGCARCGREAMDDCWAMGAMMDYDSQAVTGTTHLACVYCATYQAIADFLQPNWWKLLQIEELPGSRGAMEMSVNTTLLYLQGAITSSVIRYKRRNSGALPTHVRSTYIQAKGNSIERYQSGLEPDYQHYVKQQLIENFDLEAHAPARKAVEGSVDLLMLPHVSEKAWM